MLSLFVRGLCGLLVLAGLVSGHGSAAKTEPESGRSPKTLAATLVLPVGVGTIQPGLEYQEKTVYRVYRVTAYCDRGLTAAGVRSGVGQCAAPASIPFGARVYIPALDRTFIVTDRTAKRFRHNTVDLFIPDRAQCLKFGRCYLECEITLPAQAVCYGSPRLCATLAAARP